MSTAKDAAYHLTHDEVVGGSMEGCVALDGTEVAVQSRFQSWLLTCGSHYVPASNSISTSASRRSTITTQTRVARLTRAS